MASIVSTGIGSGLDVQNLVQQLVAAEGQPTEIRIARQEARLQAELSAFGSIKSALSSFRSQVETLQEQGALQKRSVTVGNEEVFSATVDENALPAEYNIEVVQLAQSQQLISGAFTDANTAVGTGTLTISVGSSTFDVAIDSDGNTLSNIQDAINASVNNAGVSASIVNADDGSYLVLRGDTTGAAQAITVTQSGGDGGLARADLRPGEWSELIDRNAGRAGRDDSRQWSRSLEQQQLRQRRHRRRHSGFARGKHRVDGVPQHCQR